MKKQSSNPDKAKLRKVHLYGSLTKFSKKPFKLVANDTRDLFAGMRSRFGDQFQKHVLDNPNYCIVVSDKGKQNMRPVHPDFIHSAFGPGCEVHVLPASQGAGLEAVFISWGFSATAAAIASVIANVAIAFAVGAIAQSLAPKPETGNESERPEERPSFLYNGPENVVEAGFQEPVVYGSHMTGSVVVSAGITVEQVPYDSIRQPPPAGGTQPSYPDPLPWQWTGTGS